MTACSVRFVVDVARFVLLRTSESINVDQEAVEEEVTHVVPRVQASTSAATKRVHEKTASQRAEAQSHDNTSGEMTS